jgi:hypothetical protein
MENEGMIIIFGGIFTIICAAADFNWFMNNHKARLFVNLFGRDGARLFYILLGGVLITLGFMV